VASGSHQGEWNQLCGLPQERSWITFSELRHQLLQEGCGLVTHEIVRLALKGQKLGRFRAWNMYEPHHVDAVRKYMAEHPPKVNTRRRLGGKNSR